mgnify:CR=1 FL=1
MTAIMPYMFGGGAIVVTLLVFLSMYRAAAGPTAPDRVAATNMITTKTVLIIALVARYYGQEFYLDVAFVYALIGFATPIGVAKYLEKGALK